MHVMWSSVGGGVSRKLEVHEARVAIDAAAAVFAGCSALRTCRSNVVDPRRLDGRTEVYGWEGMHDYCVRYDFDDSTSGVYVEDPGGATLVDGKRDPAEVALLAQVKLLTDLAAQEKPLDASLQSWRDILISELSRQPFFHGYEGPRIERAIASACVANLVAIGMKQDIPILEAFRDRCASSPQRQSVRSLEEQAEYGIDTIRRTGR